jgi:hypothetical protein
LSTAIITDQIGWSVSSCSGEISGGLEGIRSLSSGLRIYTVMVADYWRSIINKNKAKLNNTHKTKLLYMKTNRIFKFKTVKCSSINGLPC